MRAIDCSQVGLLRALATRFGTRLFLKGGMAMRVPFGSLRLTKDIDFERDPTLPKASLRKTLPRALNAAALAGALQGPQGFNHEGYPGHNSRIPGRNPGRYWGACPI